MVTSVTSLTGNGLKDWLIQRVSAIYILGYTLFLLGYSVLHAPFSYTQWSSLFDCLIVKILTVLTLIMFLLHAWIGIWTVTTDYLPQKPIRLLTQTVVALWLTAQFIWGLTIVWG